MARLSIVNNRSKKESEPRLKIKDVSLKLILKAPSEIVQNDIHFFFLMMETICMKYQGLYSVENKKTIVNLSSAEFAKGLVKFNLIWF